MPIATRVADSDPDGTPIEHRTEIAGPGPAGAGSSIRRSIAFISIGHLRECYWLLVGTRRSGMGWEVIVKRSAIRTLGATSSPARGTRSFDHPRVTSNT